VCVQVGSVLIACAAKTSLTFWPEPARRDNDLINKELFVTKWISLILFFRVEFTKKKTQKFVLFIPEFDDMVSDL
jgi:hypothetical protein